MVIPSWASRRGTVGTVVRQFQDIPGKPASSGIPQLISLTWGKWGFVASCYSREFSTTRDSYHLAAVDVRCITILSSRHSGAPPPKMIPPIPHPEGPLEAYGRDAGFLTWNNIPPSDVGPNPARSPTNLMKNESDDRLVISNHNLMLFIPLSDPPNLPGIWEFLENARQTSKTNRNSHWAQDISNLSGRSSKN